MLSEEERARFSVSNSIMQAMIVLTPLLLSLVKHIFFVYAVATALMQYTMVLITHLDDIKRDGDVGYAMTFIFADLFCILTIISYFMAPLTTEEVVNAFIKGFMNPMNTIVTGIVAEAIIIGATATLLAIWSGILIINTIRYLRETAKP